MSYCQRSVQMPQVGVRRLGNSTRLWAAQLQNIAENMTYTNLINIMSNDDPIDRYALPNDETIKWAFYIQPKSWDKLQKGIVQPAFDHYGGGIEVYFEDETSYNTYFEKRICGK